MHDMDTDSSPISVNILECNRSTALDNNSIFLVKAQLDEFRDRLVGDAGFVTGWKMMTRFDELFSFGA